MRPRSTVAHEDRGLRRRPAPARDVGGGGGERDIPPVGRDRRLGGRVVREPAAGPAATRASCGRAAPGAGRRAGPRAASRASASPAGEAGGRRATRGRAEAGAAGAISARPSAAERRGEPRSSGPQVPGIEEPRDRVETRGSCSSVRGSARRRGRDDRGDEVEVVVAEVLQAELDERRVVAEDHDAPAAPLGLENRKSVRNGVPSSSTCGWVLSRRPVDRLAEARDHDARGGRRGGGRAGPAAGASPAAPPVGGSNFAAPPLPSGPIVASPAAPRAPR